MRIHLYVSSLESLDSVRQPDDGHNGRKKLIFDEK